MKILLQILILILSSFSLTTCTLEDNDILPGAWKLIRVETLTGDLIQIKQSSDVKGDVILELPKPFPTSFTGEAVCNKIHGEIELIGNKEIKVVKFGGTRKYCPAWGSSFENRIRNVISYDISGRKYLYLFLEEERMVFKKVH